VQFHHGMTKRVDLGRLIGETHNRTPPQRQPFLALGHPDNAPGQDLGLRNSSKIQVASWVRKWLSVIGPPSSEKKPVLSSRERIFSSFLVRAMKQQHHDFDLELCRNDGMQCFCSTSGLQLRTHILKLLFSVQRIFRGDPAQEHCGMTPNRSPEQETPNGIPEQDHFRTGSLGQAPNRRILGQAFQGRLIGAALRDDRVSEFVCEP